MSKKVASLLGVKPPDGKHEPNSRDHLGQAQRKSRVKCHTARTAPDILAGVT